MSFIIQRLDQGGGYVAREGNSSSYVRSPLDARQYPTREQADADRCPGNERVIECPYIKV